MQKIPELSKARAGDSGGKKGPLYLTVSNVDAAVCVKRFKLIGVKSLIFNDVEFVSYTSYKFPVNDKYNLVFADKLEVRDKVDKQSITKLFQFVKAAHMRGVVLSDINMRSIGVNAADGSAKVIDLSASKLCVPGNNVELNGAPNQYHAPEVHSTGNVSFASDIYSLGLWWLVARTGSTVESWNLTCPVAINQHALSTNPKFEILKRMLNINPYFRPTIQEVITEYQRENAEASVVQEQLTPSQSEALRIFRGDSSALSKLLEEQHHDTVIDLMPSLLKHVFSYAPHYKSEAFSLPATHKTMSDVLNLLHELLMKNKDPWANFLDTDFGDIPTMILSFMSIDMNKALMVAAKLRDDNIFVFTKKFGVDAIPLCKSTNDLRIMAQMLPQDENSTKTIKHILEVTNSDENELKSLKKKYDALRSKYEELSKDYDECWLEYHRLWHDLEEIERDTRAHSEKTTEILQKAGTSRKRARVES